MNKRYHFIDLFRGWAVLVMIETHVFNAWMDKSLRSSEWFSYLNFINGFVAPSFLFVAGVSFVMVAWNNWHSFTSFNPGYRKQLCRFFVIMLIGFALHLPRLDWSQGWPHIVTEDLVSFYQIDVLQTIAISLILLQLLMLWTRGITVFFIVLFIITWSALLITPFLWQKDFGSSVHPLIANLLNGKNNPLFPLFPWCVFLWSGGLVGGLFMRYSTSDKEHKIVSAIALIGVSLFAIGYISDISSIRFFEYESFWLTSPNWVLMRLGILLILFSFFWLLDYKNWHTSPQVLLFGRQSLFAYISHLVLIYSITGEKASISIFDQNLPPWLTLILWIVVCAAVYALTHLWVQLKPGLTARFKPSDKK